MNISNAQKELIRKVKHAIHYVDKGDPLKDWLDDVDIIEALALLVEFGKNNEQNN